MKNRAKKLVVNWVMKTNPTPKDILDLREYALKEIKEWQKFIEELDKRIKIKE